MAEKVRSGWSNLLSLAQRKNVVKGSYTENKLNVIEIQRHHWVSTHLIWFSVGTIIISITKIVSLYWNNIQYTCKKSVSLRCYSCLLQNEGFPLRSVIH